MKKIKSIISVARCFPVWVPFTVVFAVLTVLDTTVWAIVDQFVGVIPDVGNVHFLWWWLEFPFAVSRLWDILLGPLYIIIFTYLCSCDCFYGEGAWGTPLSSSSTFGTLTSCSLVVSAYFGMLLGVLYALPIFLLSFLSILILGILWVLVSNSKWINRLLTYRHVE